VGFFALLALVPESMRSAKVGRISAVALSLSRRGLLFGME